MHEEGGGGHKRIQFVRVYILLKAQKIALENILVIYVFG